MKINELLEAMQQQPTAKQPTELEQRKLELKEREVAIKEKMLELKIAEQERKYQQQTSPQEKFIYGKWSAFIIGILFLIPTAIFIYGLTLVYAY